MSKLFEAQDGDYVQLPQGELQYHNNEQHLLSSVDDPPGMSFLGGSGAGRSLGKLSWKHHGMEQVLIQGKLRDDGGGGEIYVGVLDEAKYVELTAAGDVNALDHAMVEVMNIQSHLIEFRVPVVTRPTTTAEHGTYDGVQLYGSEDRFLYARQTDGHDVLYRLPEMTPIWSSDGGPNGTWLQTAT